MKQQKHEKPGNRGLLDEQDTYQKLSARENLHSRDGRYKDKSREFLNKNFLV